MNEEFGEKYNSLLAFIETSLEPELHLLTFLMNREESLNVSILRAIGQEEAEMVITQAKDAEFLPAMKLELQYEEKSKEEKAIFKENVEDTLDFLTTFDLETIFN